MLSHPIELEQMEEPQCQPYEASVLRQAIELIVQKLTPEQRTVLLLIDGLKFTSKETARMLNTTEGAVKALLYRGRTKLKTTGGPQRRDEDKDKVNRPYSSDSASEVDESIVYAYIKAFREQNVAALMMLMNEGSRDVLPAVQYLHSDKLEKKKTHGKALKARSFIESMAA
jgi:RNA polymerase sigma-70 factor (ECF subfamily)